MNETTIIDLACELAELHAREDAASAAEVARAAPEGEPVQFITGNSFMPPLRAYGRAEDFWAAASHADSIAAAEGNTADMLEAVRVWDTYAEAFEEACERENILCECPEYDNALYVVDLKRFEYVDDSELPDSVEDGAAQDATLHDEWRLIVRGDYGAISEDQSPDEIARQVEEADEKARNV